MDVLGFGEGNLVIVMCRWCIFVYFRRGVIFFVWWYNEDFGEEISILGGFWEYGIVYKWYRI